jgi:biotin carboxylase
MARHFVFVESNTTGTGRLAVERLLDRGDGVTFVSRQPEKYPFLAARASLDVVRAETNDSGALDRAFVELAARRPVDALLTFSSFYVVPASELAARHGLRSLGPRAALACHDKYETRRAQRAAGLRAPRCTLLAGEAEARAFAASAAYPLVLKPRAESGSTGVRLVRDADELVAHFGRLASRTVNERGQALRGEALAEELLEGPEYSVETLTTPGAEPSTTVVAVTAKHLSAAPYFVETGHDVPAALSPAAREALAAEALAALRAVSFDCGPAHTEIRLTAGGPVVVEINPRLAGGMIPELVAHATGVDLLSAWLSLLVGDPVDLEPSRRWSASIRFVLAGAGGVLEGVEGLDAARALPTVREVAVDKPIGARVGPAASALDRLGRVIAAGPDRAAVLRDLEEAIGRVRLSIRAEGSDSPGRPGAVGGPAP